MTEEEQKHLRELAAYLDEQARVADANSKEWLAAGAGGKENAAYRKGMWYAYNDIRNQLPLDRERNELRDLLRYVAYFRLPLGNTVFDLLDLERQKQVHEILSKTKV